MKKKLSNLAIAALTLAGAVGGALIGVEAAQAQVAGSTTTVDVSVMQATTLAMGWSVKKTLLDKTIYNDAGNKVGEVEDLIISPDKSVSYVIVGAGGFVGIGRHDVAIPVTQIQEKGGRLVMAGATKDSIKAMPEFTYATDSKKRDAFVADAEKDIAKGRAKLADMEKKAVTLSMDAKAKADLQISSLQLDVKSAESKLSEMKQASAARWKEFEASVNAATARLRKSVDSASV